MTVDKFQQDNLAYLILLAVEGTINKDEFERLSALLKASRSARRYYADILDVHLLLDEIKVRKGFCEKSVKMPFNTLTDSDQELPTESTIEQQIALLNRLAEYEKNAPVLDTPKEDTPPPRELIQKVEREPVFRWPEKSSLITFLTSAAALIILLALPLLLPDKSRVEVATLSDSIDAVWDGRADVMSTGRRFAAESRFYKLQSGFATLRFDNGVQVTLEGPTKFNIIDSDQITLDYGTLYAVVSPRVHRFEVHTPTAQITDLGTEFGVYVDISHETHVHMFKGRALLVAGGQHSTSRREAVVAGQSRGVTANGSIREIPRQDRLFVRQMSSRDSFLWRGENVDLADVLGGGSGFGDGRLDYSIHPDTGQLQQGFHRHDNIDTTAQHSYVAVEDLPLIDGVFVPDGRRSPVVVSSRGDVFEECPATDGRYYWNISNGFYIHGGHYRQVLGDTRYGTKERPAISMHANSGITFDLDRMRENLPAFELTAFRSLCGRTPINPALEKDEPADIYVLVDGQVRFHYENVTTQDDSRLLDVSLSGDDRFLTLVILSRTNMRSRRAIFALPKIVIQPIY